MVKKIFYVLTLVLFMPALFMFSGCKVNNESPSDFLYEISADGKYIYFGEYPQTIKADDVVVSEFPDAQGYYEGSDGARYVKIQANYWFDGIVDVEELKLNYASDNTVMGYCEFYYFKVEKLKWRILEEKNGKAFLVCDNILTATMYNGAANAWDDETGDPMSYDNNGDLYYLNNYKESSLRGSLAGIYNVAFTEEEKQIISLTEVDNSVNTLPAGAERYACENTNDYLFALSYADICNSNYGFSGALAQDIVKSWATTDYAKANGAITHTKEYFTIYCNMAESSAEYKALEAFIGSGEAMLRSPSVYGGQIKICNNGEITNYDTDYSHAGVVPAMYITL